MSRWMLTLAGLALIGAGGCMKLEQELTLNADGSADIKMSYAMSEQAIAQLEAMKQMAEKNPDVKMESSGPNLIFDEAKIRADIEKKGGGVEIKSCKVETKDGWKHVTLELHGKDLAAAAKATEASGNKGGMSLSKNADGNYVLDMGGTKDMAGGDDGKKDPQQKAQEQQMMKAMMAGLRVAIKVNVPGDVVETTAFEKDKRSASWVLDINDPKFFDRGEELGKKGAKVVFSGKGLALKEFKSEGGSAPAKDAEPK